MGLQVVRVATRRGWVVLASDASHFYANMEQIRPFPIVWSVADMVDGYRKLRALADSPAHIIPGHDPLVLQRYPAPSKELRGNRGQAGLRRTPSEQLVDRVGRVVLELVPEAAPVPLLQVDLRGARHVPLEDRVEALRGLLRPGCRA